MPRLSMLCLMLGAICFAGRAECAEPTAEQLKFFETSVRPLLVEHCQKCHGEKKQWGALRLDSHEALLKGGENGPAIVPGKPEESRLIRAIRHTDDDLQMPPDEKLSDRQIAILVEWVRQGAPYPASAAGMKERFRDPNHWAFQPARDPAVPMTKNKTWPQTGLDHFVLARLESAGLSPAAEADRRTLIRRVTFDLTGLPPTPEEVEAFLADADEGAYSRLIERLLASPAYGERWGRHWLDVARYADSNGLDENVAHGNAWRYRDYVIDAFNRDLPYDQFVVEQLAGDLLTPTDQADRQQKLIATGFLALGAKVLAEVDETKMQMDIVDEQIDTVGRALLGMTFGCARCHDHKFDPVSTADYYGLAGVFKSTRTMEHFKKVAKWHENLLPSPESEAQQAAYAAQVEAKTTALKEATEAAETAARAGLNADAKPPEKLETLFPAETKAKLKQLKDELSQLEKAAPELPSAMGATEAAVADVPIHVRGNHLKLGDVVPRHVPVVMRGPASPAFPPDQSGRLELANWLVDPQHPLTARVMVNRVWRWHFGKGLVRTPDNFGLLGEAPTHPELLDWLTVRFVEGGWSIKSLHRLIVLSATYRQSSQAPDATRQADPDNLLYGRMDLRRLEAEEVRDALLSVSGQLDRTPGGPVLKVKNRGYLFDHTSKDLTDYSSVRRSVYLPIIRNNLYDVFQLLDFPDASVPSGDRSTTVIAPQALMMLNSDFVMQAADKFAERLLADAGIDDVERARRMYRLAYGRDGTDEELAAAQSFQKTLEEAMPTEGRDTAARRMAAWSGLCQVVLAANELVYLR